MARWALSLSLSLSLSRPLDRDIFQIIRDAMSKMLGDSMKGSAVPSQACSAAGMKLMNVYLEKMKVLSRPMNEL